MSNRINLYFPDGHWILGIPSQNRARRIKEILDTLNDLESIKADIAEIKVLLMQSRVEPLIKTIPQPVSQKIDEADRDLIMKFLDF